MDSKASGIKMGHGNKDQTVERMKQVWIRRHGRKNAVAADEEKMQDQVRSQRRADR